MHRRSEPLTNIFWLSILKMCAFACLSPLPFFLKIDWQLKIFLWTKLKKWCKKYWFRKVLLGSILTLTNNFWFLLPRRKGKKRMKSCGSNYNGLLRKSSWYTYLIRNYVYILCIKIHTYIKRICIEKNKILKWLLWVYFLEGLS